MGLCLESGSEVLRREESEVDDCWSIGWLVMTCDMEEKCRLDDSRIVLGGNWIDKLPRSINRETVSMVFTLLLLSLREIPLRGQ